MLKRRHFYISVFCLRLNVADQSEYVFSSKSSVKVDVVSASDTTLLRD